METFTTYHKDSDRFVTANSVIPGERERAQEERINFFFVDAESIDNLPLIC